MFTQQRALATRGLTTLMACLGLLGCNDLHTGLDGQWTATAPPGTWRLRGHAATLLLDGSVLVTGGVTESNTSGQEIVTDAVERYDPSLNAWSPLPPMPYPQEGHSASVLGDGSVLVVGSQLDARFTPGSGQWVQVNGRLGGQGCGAVALEDGSALAVNYGDVPSAYRFDPATSEWTLLAMPPTARVRCRLVRLTSGEVMAVGGLDGPVDSLSRSLTSDVFSPATGTWRASGSLAVAIDDAVSLPDGGVLAIGITADGPRALRWSPSTEQWAESPAPLGAPESNLPFQGSLTPGGMVVLDDRVVVLFQGNSLPTVQVFSLRTGTWDYLRYLDSFFQVATRLNDGRVLATGLENRSLSAPRAAVLTP